MPAYRTDPPPMDGRWILAYDPTLPEFTQSRPWVIATRTDEGFADEEGFSIEVKGWVPLPDPQPRFTGWTKPVGKVTVCPAYIDQADWSGWLTRIVRPDGTPDEARFWVVKDEAEADLKAQWFADNYGLPIEKDRGDAPQMPTNVIPFGRKGEPGQ